MFECRHLAGIPVRGLCPDLLTVQRRGAFCAPAHVVIGMRDDLAIGICLRSQRAAARVCDLGCYFPSRVCSAYGVIPITGICSRALNEYRRGGRGSAHLRQRPVSIAVMINFLRSRFV